MRIITSWHQIIELLEEEVLDRFVFTVGPLRGVSAIEYCLLRDVGGGTSVYSIYEKSFVLETWDFKASVKKVNPLTLECYTYVFSDVKCTFEIQLGEINPISQLK